MANSGPNTNKSSFFLSYKANVDLDNKHTVFGEITKGIEFLEITEQLPTKKEKFKGVKVEILGTDVLENPFENSKNNDSIYLKPPEMPKREANGSTVGKYLVPRKREAVASVPIIKRPRRTFDFSKW